MQEVHRGSWSGQLFNKMACRDVFGVFGACLGSCEAALLYLYLLHTWASTGIIGIDREYEAPGEVHEFGLA
jgi:hypothetical protein